MSFLAFLLSFVSGCFGGLGLGGGWILYAWLTASGEASPEAARGIILLLFLPCAAVALTGHVKTGLADLQTLWAPSLAGAAVSLAGVRLYGLIPAAASKWIMAASAAALGIYELVCGIKEAAASLKGS